MAVLGSIFCLMLYLELLIQTDLKHEQVVIQYRSETFRKLTWQTNCRTDGPTNRRTWGCVVGELHFQLEMMLYYTFFILFYYSYSRQLLVRIEEYWQRAIAAMHCKQVEETILLEECCDLVRMLSMWVTNFIARFYFMANQLNSEATE